VQHAAVPATVVELVVAVAVAGRKVKNQRRSVPGLEAEVEAEAVGNVVDLRLEAIHAIVTEAEAGRSMIRETIQIPAKSLEYLV